MTPHLGSTYREPRLLYWNTGGGKFKDITASSGPGITLPASSRGLATADFWNDGRISAVINNMGEKPMLLVNIARNQNHWLGIAAVGTTSNRDAIGARVTLTAGGKTYVQELRSGGSYISNSDIRLHYGIGSATKIDNLEVIWPTGNKERFTVPVVDRIITITEGTGISTPAKGSSVTSAK